VPPFGRQSLVYIKFLELNRFAVGQRSASICCWTTFWIGSSLLRIDSWSNSQCNAVYGRALPKMVALRCPRKRLN
jgi:hypothetical protein